MRAGQGAWEIPRVGCGECSAAHALGSPCLAAGPALRAGVRDTVLVPATAGFPAVVGCRLIAGCYLPGGHLHSFLYATAQQLIRGLFDLATSITAYLAY